MISLQKLLGKEERFFELLEASASEARSSVQTLIRFVSEPGDARALDELIAARRKEKRIVAEISEALCTTFVSGLEREDIEALSLALYKIPKTVEKIAERILLAPHFLKPNDLSPQLQLLERATNALVSMIQELRRGMPLEQIRILNDKLQEIEGEADKLILDLLRGLYSGKGDAVQVVFLKDLFELLERATDRCRDAGNVVNHIALKNK